ncbi:MAG: ATP-binding protein [Bacteroidetes bacterium]|nr:ATP-binding protein [Bacteroidota bacterium]
MRIAVASGKGGTGKTMLAVSLAHLLSRARNVTLLDLDVEEPNSHLFFDLPLLCQETAWSMIPEIDEEYCTHCGTCQRVCAYHALLCLEDQVLVFPELCKGCRGCVILCPEGAMRDGKKMIGSVELREGAGVSLRSGRLKVGETAAPALIRDVKKHAASVNEITILDAPPGTACAAVEAVREADYTVLVAEATPFGLHDLELMVKTMRTLRQQFGVVINKAVTHDRTLQQYCAAEQIDILGELPYSESIARACARGAIVTDVLPETVPLFEQIITAVMRCEEVAA